MEIKVFVEDSDRNEAGRKQEFAAPPILMNAFFKER
jgi:hypothetical protein